MSFHHPFKPVALRPRHDGWTAERQIKFIQALADTGCIEHAARSVGMSACSARVLYRREGAGAFRGAWDAALDCRTPRLEQAVFDRTINGVPRPIFYKGEQVGEWRHFDERLSMFLLRSRRPDRYGRWADGPPPPAMLPGDQVRPPEHPATRLEGHLEAIEYRTPHEDGFPVDWPEDDQEPEQLPANDGDGAGQ